MSAARAPAESRPTHYRLERLASLIRQALGLVDADRLPELASLELTLQQARDLTSQLLTDQRAALA